MSAGRLGLRLLSHRRPHTGDPDGRWRSTLLSRAVSARRMAPSRVSEPDRCDLASAQARKRSTPAASFGLQGQTTVLRSLWSRIRTCYSRGINSVLYPMSYPLQASLVPVARRDSNPERSCERRKPCACRQSMTPSSESFAEHGWTNCMTAPPAPLARRHQLCFLDTSSPVILRSAATSRPPKADPRQ